MAKDKYAHQRGKIRDNALKALVTDKIFSTRIVQVKKGKGSYKRRERYGNRYDENPIISILRSIDYWVF